ncbi:hypothetical protein V8D89_005399 [Ganoderma adspersum]
MSHPTSDPDALVTSRRYRTVRVRPAQFDTPPSHSSPDRRVLEPTTHTRPPDAELAHVWTEKPETSRGARRTVRYTVTDRKTMEYMQKRDAERARIIDDTCDGELSRCWV